MSDLCYLDGRYIDLALGDDMRYSPRPLLVNIVQGRDGKMYGSASMEHVNFRDPRSMLIRVIIQTPQSRHSNALVLVADNGRVKAYRFDPFPGGPYHEFVNTLLREYLKQSGILKADADFVDASQSMPDIKAECYGSGFCAAYVLKWLDDTRNNRRFDGSNIREYARSVVDRYGPINGSVVLDNPDVEYGWYYGPGYGYPYYGPGYGFSPGGALVGGLGGAVIGGAVGGPVGALAGGTLGAVAGGALF